MHFSNFWRSSFVFLFLCIFEKSFGEQEVDFNNTQVDSTNLKGALELNNLQNRNGSWFSPNSEKPFSGFVKQEYENTQVKYFIRFSLGKMDQISFWKENGIPVYSVEIIPGSMYPKSIPLKMEELDGNKFHGLARFWFPSGHAMLEARYSFGKRNGVMRAWYENGNQKVEENYKDGLKDGNARSWYENGKKWMNYTHWQDKRDGPLIWWYENGQKRQEGNYKGGVRFGEWTYYKENGSLLYRKIFRDGEAILTKYDDGSEDKE